MTVDRPQYGLAQNAVMRNVLYAPLGGAAFGAFAATIATVLGAIVPILMCLAIFWIRIWKELTYGNGSGTSRVQNALFGGGVTAPVVVFLLLSIFGQSLVR
ncbi:MAG: hypothetical protein ACU0DW_08900 [Shimia sp.]